MFPHFHPHTVKILSSHLENEHHINQINHVDEDYKGYSGMSLYMSV
jgi:hypothetical protein